MAVKLTPDQMVTVKAIAPFEIAEAMAFWCYRARRDLDAWVEANGREMTARDEPDSSGWAGGLGPPCPTEGERPREFGERCAAAIFTLLKEI